MATKKDLYLEVKRLNDKYCKKTKNKIGISEAYGGYQVVLTGKKKKNSYSKYLKNSLGSGCASITYGYGSARSVLSDLYKSDSKGWLKSSIKHHEKRK